jgi:hypothetical protein
MNYRGLRIICIDGFYEVVGRYNGSIKKEIYIEKTKQNIDKFWIERYGE